MYRKTALFCILALLAGVSGGCSETPAPADSTAETQAVTEAKPVSKELYYITGNGTTAAADVSDFRAQLETDGYVWHETTLSDIPADADAIIVNAPTQDITKEEMNSLNAYMNEGGHMLLLLPAYEEDTEFKYLSQFLEPYCIAFDYNRIAETDASRTLNGDMYYVQTDYINRPDNMPLYSSAQDAGIVHFRDARSFHYLYQDHFSTVKQDVILKTAASVVGEPYGGQEDDPLTYEETALSVMGFARNETLANASIVFVGAADFLENSNYSDENCAPAAAWVHSSLDWFVLY
ncbi:MAG: Gldg family protein [Oscillospiraceae bacterium]|nr:Gldg family protein [Oscillospiraceae bacterium]